MESMKFRKTKFDWETTNLVIETFGSHEGCKVTFSFLFKSSLAFVNVGSHEHPAHRSRIGGAHGSPPQ